jgi:hyperosmotically inducible protein
MPAGSWREVLMINTLAFSVMALVVSVNVAAAASVDAADRKDFQVLKDVATSVDRYSQFTIFDDVSARVKDGHVTLSGKVTMPFKRDDIERRVSKVAGVVDLRDEITVLPVSTFDDDLRFKIARSIYGHSNFWNYAIMPNPPIHIVVEHGRVTLTGVVNSEVDRMLARSLASQSNAFSVTNDLKTDAEVKEALEKVE